MENSESHSAEGSLSTALAPLRERLDAIDASIVEALAERQRVVDDVGKIKLSEAGPLRDLFREETLLARLADRARHSGIDGHLVVRLFREVLDHSLRRQQDRIGSAQDPTHGGERPVRVAFQGIEGAYGHLAATRHFGARASVVYRGFPTFREAIDAVESGDAENAVLPIENTTAGSINEVYDLLSRTNLPLVGEEVLKVDHCLLALKMVPVGDIRRIYSHPQALTQCSEFIRTLGQCEVESISNTAEAAARVQSGQNLSSAAIASEEAARLYNLQVIRRDIANQRENFTRFVVIGAKSVSYDLRIPCKTSLIVGTKHEQGALLSCLNVLASHHLNLCKLESRPRPGVPWEYLFYLDFEGNLADRKVGEALEALTPYTSLLRVLGSYPARTTADSRPAEPRPTLITLQGVAPPEPAPVAPAVLSEKIPYRLASRRSHLQDTLIRAGNVAIGGPRVVVVAGPCSVESREQIMACARIAKEAGADMLRGGCFKPRSNPYAFQGHGLDSLQWLAEAGRTYGLPIVTEVLDPADLEPIAAVADVLQVGARNMQNTSLLKELGRVDRPILLKRGMMASIEEWLCAAEYILAHGNGQVILCERGIRSFETATRNTLDISAVPVVRERSHLPIFVDPSHAVGVRRWVTPLAEAAVACGAQGIMIEFHPDPDIALSDGPQSLDFAAFRLLMARIRQIEMARVPGHSCSV